MEPHSTNNQEHAVKRSEVFVGGLARTTSENKIHEEFSSCGEIAEIRLIKDQKGNSKGYCFVRFSTKGAADKAVREKSGSMLDGKKIGVLPSADQDTLYFGNLPKEWSSDAFGTILRQVFADVASVDLPKPLSSGDILPSTKQQNRGFAFVKFSSHAAAARAYRAGSKSDFSIAGICNPVVEWAKDEPEIDPDELAKVKIAFVRNLPTDSDENYLKNLFEPRGKLEKVVLSRKGRNTVGFIHFANRSDLDNAVKEMNGLTVQGPNGGPPFMITVEVARPVDKNRKRAHSDAQNKTVGKIVSQPKALMDDQILCPNGGSNSKAQRVKYSTEEAVVADPYEAAVVSLPMVVKERLLRIMRLGIATRFDINIQHLTSLKELPESNAISVLDQFMLSGADSHNKGAYLSELISRYRVDKLALDGYTFSQRRVGDIASTKSTLSSFSDRIPLPVADPLASRLASSGRFPPPAADPLASRLASSGRVPPPAADYLASRFASSGRVPPPAADPLASRLASDLFRYDDYTSRYTSSIPDYRVSGQASYGKLEEAGPVRLHQIPYSSSSTSFGQFGLRSHHPTATPTATATADVEKQPTRTQVRFDPFTGEQYKFDPFTGEPIHPESSSRAPY